MKIAVISLTENGRKLSKRIAENLSEHKVVRFCFYKHKDEDSGDGFTNLEMLVKELLLVFGNYNALVFVCACGIAVRVIAPYIGSKQTDPAIIVTDETGKFVIPILSGHLGGANALAKKIAENISATPVITTATDIGGKFSPDSFAKANNLIIKDMKAAKEIAAAVLNDEKIGFCSEYKAVNMPCEVCTDTAAGTGVYVGSEEKTPFPVTLWLVPKNIVVGAGCKRNIPKDIFEESVLNALDGAGIELSRVCALATIDRKADEPAILSFGEKYGIPVCTYTADELEKAEGDFTASEFVQSITGTDNVCERSAALCSKGTVLMRKTAANGVTVAAAEKPVILDFGKEIL